MTKTADNITKVRARIQQAARENHRDVSSIRLLAVSKTRSAEEIREAFAQGISEFGESYAQEGQNKIKQLSDLAPMLTWHFIGPLQSNKTGVIAENFAWLHSLDRLKIAERLNQQRAGRPPLNVCIQINIDNEATKSGILASELNDFASIVLKQPHLKLRGLMAIPRQDQDSNQLKCVFAKMRGLFAGLQHTFPDQTIDTLSMGMSSDFEIAIAEGSTLVRIGTDIFGPRK